MPPSCALFGGFAMGARVALLWQHYGFAWQSPAVIRQAHRTPYACRTRILRMLAKTPLAGDKIDAPAAFAVPFRPYCGGVVTRTRNVSEYMLVLALCLVVLVDVGSLIMADMRSRCGHYFCPVSFHGRPINYIVGQTIIFSSCGFFFFFFLFSSPNLSGRRLDVYHTCTRGVALV